MSKKFVLVGAGSAQFGMEMLGGIFSSEILKGAEVVLLDINAEAVKTVEKFANDFINKENLTNTVKATTERKEAFKNADFIIISIEVGNRFDLWDEDWKIPQQYGITQVYGENGGPGGVFHSLRIIPPILDICKDAVEICPDAYIFCYSNPMTAITTTVHRAFPGIRFTGMCHEIASLERYLPRMLNMKYEDMDLTAGGLNHFSCLLEAKDKKTGKDLYPEIVKKAYNFFDKEIGYSDILDYYHRTGEVIKTEGALDRAKLDIKQSAFEWADRKLFKFVLDHYGLLPITGDSHFGEYISWAWEVADHRGILDFYDFYRLCLGEAYKPEIKLEAHERSIAIIEGILTNNAYKEAAVNIPNSGYIEDLPKWIAVEVPGKISANGIEGYKLNNIPKGFIALLRNYTGVYDLTAEAVLTGKREYVIQALLANPVVNKAKNIPELVDRMIRTQNKWLGYIK